jgi:hypothetical protein
MYYDKICLTNTVLIFPLILIAYFNTAFRLRANTDKFTSGFNPSCILHRGVHFKLSLLHNCTNEESYFYLKSCFHMRLSSAVQGDITV